MDRAVIEANMIMVLLKFQAHFLLMTFFRAASHEPGHAIGIGDQRDGGLMEYGGNSLDVKANYIASSLKYAGFNCQGPQDITFPTSPCKVSVRGNTPKGLGVVTKRK